MAIRVVVSGEDHDLLVPADVPVVELLGELSGPGGPYEDPLRARGARLVRADGRVLSPGVGLRIQGVVDGTVVALVPDEDLGHRDGAEHDAEDEAVAAVAAVRRRSAGAGSTSTDLAEGRPLLVGALCLLAAGLLAAGPHPGAPPATPLALGLAAVVGLGGVLTGRRHDLPTGLTAIVGAGLVATVVVLREPSPTSAVLARLGTLLGLMAIGALLTVPRRADLALAPTVAGLLALGAGAVLAWVPVTPTQVAVVVLAVAALAARAVPWVAVAAVDLDRAADVAPAGRRRPGSTGGVDLAALDRAVAAVRSSVQATTWGLGAVAVVAAAAVAAAGHGGLVLSGVVGLLLVCDPGAAPSPRSAGTVTGGAVLCSALLSAGADRTDVPAVVLAALVVVAVLAVTRLVVRDLVVRDRDVRDRDVEHRLAGGRPRRRTDRWAALRTTVQRVALLTVPPLVACGLGLLPTPWGLP